MLIADYYFPMLTTEPQLEDLVTIIRNHVADYIQKYHLQSLVLGISGGIDSALCAVLLRPVCQKLNISLIGLSITIETNKNDEIERSKQVGEAFCSYFEYQDITQLYKVLQQDMPQIDDTMRSKLRMGNLKARMRMLKLYDMAQLHQGLVISTDNFTEFLTGFWTLHGDVGDYAPIQHLWKTEVYALATHLLKECSPSEQQALQVCIDATPVDGLGISESDCEQLGVSNYFEADRIFKRFFEGDQSLSDHPLIRRYFASEYKRKHPVAIGRGDLYQLRIKN
ncbi:MAG: NAD(+) synthase [Bacteroidales bacterium]|nr:NAD(+) synthase [Bacteroidales bacterium]